VANSVLLNIEGSKNEMMLKPLEQWFCDTCIGIIEKPEDG
jgi:hypothetical protein